MIKQMYDIFSVQKVLPRGFNDVCFILSRSKMYTTDRPTHHAQLHTSTHLLKTHAYTQTHSLTKKNSYTQTSPHIQTRTREQTSPHTNTLSLIHTRGDQGEQAMEFRTPFLVQVPSQPGSVPDRVPK